MCSQHEVRTIIDQLCKRLSAVFPQEQFENMYSQRRKKVVE